MDTARIAQRLVRATGWRVFPATYDKKPTIKGWQARASKEALGVSLLWHERPGPLIAIACGTLSGVSVLDIDQTRHPEAGEWWRQNQHRLRPTLAYATRSGGTHHYYADPEGIARTTQGGRNGLPVGCDTRGRSGFVVWWHAIGCQCLCDQSPAPWPQWITEAMRRSERRKDIQITDTPKQISADHQPRYEAFVRKVLHSLSRAPNGTKHVALLRAAHTLGGVRAAIGWTEERAVGALLEQLPDSGPNAVRDWDCAERTVRAALAHGERTPLILVDRSYNREVVTA
jgi:bifunctional DNA primase/polymerase-like protein